MDTNRSDKFEILRRLATEGTSGANINALAQTALQMTAELVGLTAASLLLWNDKQEMVTTVTYAGSDDHRRKLQSLEEDLFASLRKDRKLVSAYMSFGGEVPLHSFSLPLQYLGVVNGAVIGLQEGPRTIVAEDTFLEALSAMLTLVYTAGDVTGSVDIQKTIDEARMAAIAETAVTVNHEVNNPLTAILGNVQLLLFKRDDLDDELKAKLKVIEEAALSIKDVTQKLLGLKKPRTKDYTDGTSMLDLSGGDDTE